jgi:hypothetical protein
MYEIALREWGRTPEYINTRWTEELLGLMFQSRTRNLIRSAEARQPEGSGLKYVQSDAELFRSMGYSPEEVITRAH